MDLPIIPPLLGTPVPQRPMIPLIHTPPHPIVPGGMPVTPTPAIAPGFTQSFPSLPQTSPIFHRGLSSADSSPTFDNSAKPRAPPDRLMVPIIVTNIPDIHFDEVTFLVEETIKANIGEGVEWHLLPVSKSRLDGFIVVVAILSIATRFIECMNGLMVNDKTLEAKLMFPQGYVLWPVPAPQKKDRKTSEVNHNRVFVGNVPYRTSLNEFSTFCFNGLRVLRPLITRKIMEITVPRRIDPMPFYGDWTTDNYQGRGYALITFDDNELAWLFIEVFDGVVFRGRELNVRFDKYPQVRNHSQYVRRPYGRRPLTTPFRNYQTYSAAAGDSRSNDRRSFNRYHSGRSRHEYDQTPFQRSESTSDTLPSTTISILDPIPPREDRVWKI